MLSFAARWSRNSALSTDSFTVLRGNHLFRHLILPFDRIILLLLIVIEPKVSVANTRALRWFWLKMTG
jgi:hypothetical protein